MACRGSGTHFLVRGRFSQIVTGKYPVGVAKYVEKKETHLVTST